MKTCLTDEHQILPNNQVHRFTPLYSPLGNQLQNKNSYRETSKKVTDIHVFILVRYPTEINLKINLPHLHQALGRFDYLNFPLETDCNMYLQATVGPQSQEQTHSVLWSAHTVL